MGTAIRPPSFLPCRCRDGVRSAKTIVTTMAATNIATATRKARAKKPIVAKSTSTLIPPMESPYITFV